MEFGEYVARSEVGKALEELDSACFASRERGEGEEAFPDARQFLVERGIEPPSGRIHVRHTIEAQDMTAEQLKMKPERPICPDGGGECVPRNCRLIKGEMICSWICNCP
jgi:hypothetical protein